VVLHDWFVECSRTGSGKRMHVLLFALLLSVFPALGQEVHPNDNQPICAKPPCTFIHVDAVSYYDSQVQKNLGLKAPMISNIMVSNGQGTYLLTCSPKDQTCVAPTVDANYEFIDKGGKWAFLKDLSGEYPGETTIFLHGAGGFLGVYRLEAHVPITPGSEVQRLIATCKAKQDFPDEVRCAKWLNRREEARRDACPDADATLACRSFQELIAAGDFMGDFAQKDHVLTCFRKKEDVFFNLWFIEPDETRWQQENTTDRTLTQSDMAAFDYYKQGVWSFNLSVGAYGKWKYIPAGPVCNATCRKEATSGHSKYDGHNDSGDSIRIDNERAVLSESFNNKTGSRTTHEVIVQLSTGRFTERFTWPKSSGVDETEESTGRCLILTPLDKQQ
jgi:hypothetical protein